MQQRLVPHANRCVKQYHSAEQSDRMDEEEFSDAFHNLGDLYSDQGKLTETKKMYQRALNENEKAWGPKHTSTLDTVNNLGLLYSDQGKLAETKKMYQRTLDEKEKAWDPKHTSTLDTVNNLGLLYKDQGKPADSEI